MWVLLLIQKRNGFTRRINSYATDDPGRRPWDMTAGKIKRIQQVRALVEGPYGNEKDLGSYSTVILFAQDIGIAGQLPYIKRLVEGYYRYQIKTRRIRLFWEIKSEIQIAWATNLLSEIFLKDPDRVFDARVYVCHPDPHISEAIETQHHNGLTEDTDSKLTGETVYDFTENTDIELTKKKVSKSLRIMYHVMDVKSLLETELTYRRGNTVISISTNGDTSDRIREIVRRDLDPHVSLEEVEFRLETENTHTT